MKANRPLKIGVRPKDDPAINSRPGGQNVPDVEMNEIGNESHKKQSNRYFTGRSSAGKNSPFLPREIGPSNSGFGGDPGRVRGSKRPVTGNDLGEVVDRSGKAPYGREGMGWSEKSGKLGDLDPQETDQPSWVGTWSKLNTGSYGAGVTIDENYGVQRPRTYSRQKERFEECNPEFQDVADDGDWTSCRWTPDV